MAIQQMLLGVGGPLTYTDGTSWTGDLGAQDGTTVDLIFNDDTSTGLFGKGNSTYPFTYWFTNLPVITTKLRLYVFGPGSLWVHTSDGSTSAGSSGSSGGWQNLTSNPMKGYNMTKIVLHGQTTLAGIEIDNVVLVDE